MCVIAKTDSSDMAKTTGGRLKSFFWRHIPTSRGQEKTLTKIGVWSTAETET